VALVHRAKASAVLLVAVVAQDKLAGQTELGVAVMVFRPQSRALGHSVQVVVVVLLLMVEPLKMVVLVVEVTGTLAVLAMLVRLTLVVVEAVQEEHSWAALAAQVSSSSECQTTSPLRSLRV
jgi:hypothetical protein